jgi:hypothetical protein
LLHHQPNPNFDPLEFLTEPRAHFLCRFLNIARDNSYSFSCFVSLVESTHLAPPQPRLAALDALLPTD